MKSLLMTLFLALVTLGFSIDDAEAARFGGGRSFGIPRQVTTPKPAPARQATSAPSRTSAATPQRSGWMGPIAGLAAGIGLATLFSHLGLSEGLANMVMIMLLVMAGVFVFRMLFRRMAPQPMQYAGAGQNTATWVQIPGTTAPATSIPADFDVPQFLRVAKLNFVRLQAANDSRNLEDIREFTSPEIFAEIKLQMDERGSTAQQTDVVQLEADLLEAVTESKQHVVSVRFSGLIREQGNAVATPFDEIWVLTKSIIEDRGWVVAGIQQVS